MNKKFYRFHVMTTVPKTDEIVSKWAEMSKDELSEILVMFQHMNKLTHFKMPVIDPYGKEYIMFFNPLHIVSITVSEKNSPV